MSRIFPLRSSVQASSNEPRVVDLDDEDADAVFGALSSNTARRIYTRLDDEPATPSDVADAVDTSIQNVRYHLENLEDAGLVEVVDTWYSSRGNEMSVYATADGPLIVSGGDDEASRLKTALSRLVGGGGVLALASYAVQQVAEVHRPRAATTDRRSGGGEFAGATPDVAAEDVTPTDQPEAFVETPTGDPPATGTPDAVVEGTRSATETVANATAELSRSAEQATQTAADATTQAPPGAVFFAGGFLVLCLVVGYWYWAGR